MFTGIITHLGTVRAVEPRPEQDTLTLVLDAGGALDGLPAGGSLAVDGVCLTALRSGEESDALFRADLMGQTLAMTSLGDRVPGDRVNLERCLRPTDHLDGHLVLGHVDGVGVVLSVTPQGAWTTIRIGLPASLARYVPAQGSIALQGVSLTVTAVSAPGDAEHWFEVGIIPATLRATTLGGLAPGDRVNLETDVMARYAERLALIPATRAAEEDAHE
ncbi:MULTISPECIES: riboflavin synthase [Micrococcus]|uniref:riboflavin synthase n=1 Tax=Micrococcus antarcticus TaxID=86171 RepID=UPI0038509922